MRSSRNDIKAIKVNGVWVQSPCEVIKEVVEHFTNRVSSSNWDHQKLDNVSFEKASKEANRVLSTSFALDEIELVVKDSDGNKRLGPDDFNFSFVKNFRHLIKYEAHIMFDQFHADEVITRGFLAYFVTLILKVS
jgi:hypothetical protein